MYKAKVNPSCEESEVQSEELNEKLLQAARSGDQEGVSWALGVGAEITCIGLDIAVKRGHRAVAEAFLDHGITGYNREESLQQCDKNRETIRG